MPLEKVVEAELEGLKVVMNRSKVLSILIKMIKINSDVIEMQFMCSSALRFSTF